MSELVVVPDGDSLASVAAERFTSLASNAVAERGRFVVALSGGSTPGPTYALLTQEPLTSRVEWKRVQIFWGDERCVPPEHPDSNFHMARQVFLDHIAIPADHVHRIKGELHPYQAAAAYRAELEAVLGETGRFDLILLGLGADGHTASLFPGTSAVEEGEREAVAVYVKKLRSWRVTLTLPVINAARHVVFLVSGARKARALARAQEGEQLPAGLVRPTEGTLTWLVDRPAAARLPSSGDAD